MVDTPETISKAPQSTAPKVSFEPISKPNPDKSSKTVTTVSKDIPKTKMPMESPKQMSQKLQQKPKPKKALVKKEPISKKKMHKIPSKKAIPDKYEEGTIKVNVYSLDGNPVKEIKLPKVFDETIRPDLIRKAVVAAQANRRQPYAPKKYAGMCHSVSTWGKGRGVARVQRIVDSSRAAESPNNVGGRRAHPPRTITVWSKKINKKERLKARNAALAATANLELVQKRGHKFNKKITVPLVVPDEFNSIDSTNKVIKTLKKLKIYDDVIRALDGRHIRAGKGKMRGRKYRIPRSILLVVSEPKGIEKSARNLIGVDVVVVNNLNTELLAPGGDPGRLTVFTESALKYVGRW